MGYDQPGKHAMIGQTEHAKESQNVREIPGQERHL